MAVYDISGTELSALYDIDGSALSVAYDISGAVIFETGGGSDYDQYDTEYQHTILIARDAWKTEYRADDTVIPFILSTDQHKYLNSAHKPTFTYLGKAVKWAEVSAILNLGDVCGAYYNTTDLNNMVTCLANVPKNKQVNVYGNHDAQGKKVDGSSYAYSPLTDAKFQTLQDTYFNNATFGGNDSLVTYGIKGNESVIDPVHNVKICVFADWVNRGDPWYHYYLDSDTVEAMIAMLSEGTKDIVILSHIQPYGTQTTWYKPAVDGNEAATTTGERSHIAYADTEAIDQLIADRQAKRSGSITDCDGVAHAYDFTGCVSNVLCCLNGHSHVDIWGYSPDGTVPSITFDAYRYDLTPLYFLNVDRTQRRVHVWKFDTQNNIYDFIVPFDETEM